MIRMLVSKSKGLRETMKGLAGEELRNGWCASLAWVAVFILAVYSTSGGQHTEQTKGSGRSPNQDCIVCIYGQIANTDTFKLGVGFFVNDSGYIVTPKRVIQRLQRIEVRQVCAPALACLDTATFVDSSDRHDIAVIKIDPKRLNRSDCHSVTFADDSTLVLGGYDVEIQGWDCRKLGNYWLTGFVSLVFYPDSMKIQGYPIIGGMSGAPVFFRGSSTVVGFLNRGKPMSIEYEGRFLYLPLVQFAPYGAVHAKRVKELLKKNGIVYKESYYEAISPGPYRPGE